MVICYHNYVFSIVKASEVINKAIQMVLNLMLAVHITATTNYIDTKLHDFFIQYNIFFF